MDRRLARYRPPAVQYVADFPDPERNAYWNAMAYRPTPYVEPSVYPNRLIRPKDATLMSGHGHQQGSMSRLHGGAHHTFGAYDHLLHTSFEDEDRDLFEGDDFDEFDDYGDDEFDEFMEVFGEDSPAKAVKKAARQQKRKRNWQQFKRLFSKAAQELTADEPPPPAAFTPAPLPPMQHFQQASFSPQSQGMSKTTMVVGAVALAAAVGGVAWWAAKRG